MKTDEQIRDEVRTYYSAVARGANPGCCGSSDPVTAARRLGYSERELASAPAAANLGLGCGNPQAIAELRAGELVVDLGTGGGFDAFLAARAVGAAGHVIGVDMSADMIALARTNARRHAADNVEFRLGEIEHLPVADEVADVVISNCVINLAPDQRAVYAEAFRVLRPGGRIAISDVVALAPLPAALSGDAAARCGCVAGAAEVGELERLLGELGFTDVRVETDRTSEQAIAAWAPGQGYERFVSSARITARKPGGAPRQTSADPTPCCAPGCCA